jgi:hypothetical protein
MSSKGQEGVERKGNEQPHAKQIAHAFEPTMWGKDQERQPLPLTSDGHDIFLERFGGSIERSCIRRTHARGDEV